MNSCDEEAIINGPTDEEFDEILCFIGNNFVGDPKDGFASFNEDFDFSWDDGSNTCTTLPDVSDISSDDGSIVQCTNEDEIATVVDFPQVEVTPNETSSVLISLMKINLNRVRALERSKHSSLIKFLEDQLNADGIHVPNFYCQFDKVDNDTWDFPGFSLSRRYLSSRVRAKGSGYKAIEGKRERSCNEDEVIKSIEEHLTKIEFYGRVLQYLLWCEAACFERTSKRLTKKDMIICTSIASGVKVPSLGGKEDTFQLMLYKHYESIYFPGSKKRKRDGMMNKVMIKCEPC